jgi:DNA modification methylase
MRHAPVKTVPIETPHVSPEDRFGPGKFNAPVLLHLPIGEVKHYGSHSRVHSHKQRRKLEGLLRKFGQIAPIIVDDANVIVDGHAVHAALQVLGYDEIAVVVVQNRDAAEIRALRLVLNRVPQDAAWDDEALRIEFQALLDLGFDLEFTGFDAVEIDMKFAIDERGADDVEEHALEDLEPTAETSVRFGDVYLLGRHVVACGDARDGELLGRLANGRKVRVVFGDPPYTVKISGFVSGLGKTRHDEFAMACGEMQREEFTSFLAAFMSAAAPTFVDGAILFVCMDWRHLRELLEAGDRRGLALKNICVWTKSNAGMGSFYRSQHEFIAVFKHCEAGHQNNFELGQHGRARSNVWAYRGVNAFGRDRMTLLAAHPTVKPVAMISDALKDVSRRGDLVLDPFIGSGSTLIAAEDTGRVCIGVEVEPGYVEVAISRWQKRTGKDAIHAATGETFCERQARTRAVQADDAGLSSDPPLGGGDNRGEADHG